MCYPPLAYHFGCNSQRRSPPPRPKVQVLIGRGDASNTALQVSDEPHRLDEPICRDPDDDIVLGTAIAGSVDYIITGDKDLLVLHEVFDIKIVSPSDFIALESESRRS